MKKLTLTLLLCALSLNVACGEDAEPEPKNNTNNTTCTPTVDYYNAELKPIFEKKCTSCHVENGLAQATRMILNKEDLSDQATRDGIKAVATASSGGMALLLVKASGGAGHTGGAPIAADSEDFPKLKELVNRIENPVDCDAEKPF